MSEQCVKCGNDDIILAYHRDQNDCRWNQHWDSDAYREHLHKTCRVCGFYWRIRPLDSVGVEVDQ